MMRIWLQEACIGGACFGTLLLVSFIEFLWPCLCCKCKCFKNHSGVRTRDFFKYVRKGWVDANHMKGQAACNTTRDYLRATIFMGSTAILIVAVLAGAISSFEECFGDDLESCTTAQKILIVKIGCLVANFLAIFYVFLQSTRFMVHFSFMINTEVIEGMLLQKSLMVKVFERAHMYYSIGIRLYFLSVPLFIWLFSRWALLGATVLHLTVIYQLERAWFLEELVKETLPGLLTSKNEEDGEEGKWKDEEEGRVRRQEARQEDCSIM